jgi:tight adherence protein B
MHPVVAPRRAWQRPRRRPHRLAAVVLAVAACTLVGSPAHAAPTASIDHIEPGDGDVKLVVSLQGVPDGVTPDLGTVTTTFDDEPVESTAQSLSDAGDELKRTVILAMDVSDSMKGAKFDAAKAAANTFLDNVPRGVDVGVVTFASSVDVAQEPTQNLDDVRNVIDGLQLTKATSLYDGLIAAVKASGTDGARSVLLLSDGRDTTKTPIDTATQTVKKSDVKVDVVALAQTEADKALLNELSDAGGGQVLSADDPKALSALFASEAETLAQQVLVTAVPTEAMAGKEGTVAVTLQVEGAPVTADAFASIPGGSDPQAQDEVAAQQVTPVEPGLQIPASWMYAGIGATAVAVMLIIFLALGGPGNARQDAIDRNIEAYTRKGAKRIAEANRGEAQSQSVTQQAVAVAESVLEGQKGLESALGDRLEAAGLALKPAEWLLIHFGIAVGVGIIGLLLGGGSALFMLIALLLGLGGPWFYLSFKQRRRLAAFNAQLADTLQLMAGSLSAGLSLAQSVDTVVREGSDPMAGEFKRALIETRLGVDIEDALKGIAERMKSVDFEWVVMAIRIQRDVGGNLAELLNKVADTIREREYLERQVLTLSAEGRLSVWILGGLPPAFMGYLLLVNRSYIQPMFDSPLGWAMLILMAILLSGGIFWMKKVTKVEV